MGEAVDQAKRERELTKAALSADLARLESRVRAELDWKSRLRRDGARYAVIATVVVVAVAGGLVMRRVFGTKQREPARPEVRVSSLDDVGEQLRQLRKDLDGHGRSGSPLWLKVVLRGTTAAGAAAGTLAARQLMERYAPGDGRGMGDDAGAGAPLPARDLSGR